VLCLGLIAPALPGCGTFRETFPPRSGVEQLLISSAMDRAVEQLPTGWAEGRAVFVDYANLDAYDSPYLKQRIREVVLADGGSLAPGPEQAQVVLEVASGGVSVDKGSWLLGLPQIPLPIPFADETLVLPEAPLFKLSSYAGKAKLLFTALDPATRARFRELPTCYGRSHHRYWWLLFVGPFTTSDLPKEVR